MSTFNKAKESPADLHLNLFKCELFWPSVDSFPNFTGLELFGTPLWGDNGFFKDFLFSRINKVVSIQGKLSLLDDPQVELLLLRSCRSLSDISWCQVSLPFRFGGLGLRESVVCASAAFLGSCNGIRVLVSTLLSIKVDQLSFPNEQDAVTFFFRF